MTISYNYDICNMAFSMLGSKYASDLSMASATFTTPVEQHHVEAVRFYDTVLYALESEHNWVFCRKRIWLDQDLYEIDVTSGTNANPCVLTATAHGIKEGCGITLADFGVNDLDGEIFIAKNVAANTLQLYYPDGITSFNSTSIGTIGTGHIRMHPITGYDYKMRLPSDFLRFWKVTEYNSRWQIEKDASYSYLLTDDYEPLVEYVALVTDIAQFTYPFITCFARRLAREIAHSLADKPEWFKILNSEYERDLNKALLINARQDHNKDNDNKTDFYRESAWVQAGR